MGMKSVSGHLKMHYFQNRTPLGGGGGGARSAPQTPSWIFHPQTLNPDPSTLLILTKLFTFFCVAFEKRSTNLQYDEDRS